MRSWCTTTFPAAMRWQCPRVRRSSGASWAMTQTLTSAMKEHGVTSVMHFAAHSLVPESMADPSAYFHNNVEVGRIILDSMRAADVPFIVFSSTCATFGEPDIIPIHEEVPQKPTNPYGESKLMFEKMLGLVPSNSRDQPQHPALLQCCRRFGETGRGPQPGDTPDSHRPAGRAGQARKGGRLRGGLSYPRRQLHPRLHPHPRSGAGAYHGGGAQGGRGHSLQSGQRRRLLGQGGHRDLPRGDRPSDSVRFGAQARGATRPP